MQSGHTFRSALPVNNAKFTMRRLFVVSAATIMVALSSCGADTTTPSAPEGSDPAASAPVGTATESTINGRGAPDAHGNNNDAPYTSNP